MNISATTVTHFCDSSDRSFASILGPGLSTHHCRRTLLCRPASLRRRESPAIAASSQPTHRHLGHPPAQSTGRPGRGQALLRTGSPSSPTTTVVRLRGALNLGSKAAKTRVAAAARRSGALTTGWPAARRFRRLWPPVAAAASWPCGRTQPAQHTPRRCGVAADAMIG